MVGVIAELRKWCWFLLALFVFMAALTESQKYFIFEMKLAAEQLAIDKAYLQLVKEPIKDKGTKANAGRERPERRSNPGRDEAGDRGREGEVQDYLAQRKEDH